MKQFSLSNAWSLGLGHFSGKAAGHAILLIGLGILVPMALQIGLAGGAVGMMNPATMGQNALAGMAGLGGLLLIAMLLTYLLQMASYFGSWRLGFADESLGGATGYGLLAGLVAIVAFGVLIVLMVLIGMQLQGAGAAVLVMLLFLIPLMLLFAALYPVAMAAVAVGMFLVLLIVAAFGSSMGAMNPALAMTGGGAIGLVVGFVLALLLMWAAVRLSCTTSVMADRGTVNLLAGISESWRMTATNQWRIMAYLALIGIVLCVLLFVFAMVVGAGMMAGARSGNVPAMGTGTMIVSIVFAIPFAYLTVLIPAGIYRELRGPPAAEVFA
jgi:hypothetical protein